MKNIIITIVLSSFINSVIAAENNKHLQVTCQDYTWSDIEILVQPYLDDELFTALVMQGQSSNYNLSEAASQAMNKSLPDSIKTLLQKLIDAGC